MRDPVERIEESSRYRHPMSDLHWRRVLARLSREARELDSGQAGRAAAVIAAGIDQLDPPMRRYCLHTCPDCRDVCCRAGNVFFRLADLLYLVALGEALPIGQTRQRPGQACRYLEAAGCALARRYRPYVCTWYLCAAQMPLFNAESAADQRRLIRTLTEIRQARLVLETLYFARLQPRRRASPKVFY